jgi:hypothetical protein
MLSTIYNTLFKNNDKKTFNQTNEQVHEFRKTLCDKFDNESLIHNQIIVFRMNWPQYVDGYPTNDWNEHIVNDKMFITKSELGALIMIGDHMNKMFRTNHPVDWFKIIHDNYVEECTENKEDAWFIKTILTWVVKCESRDTHSEQYNKKSTNIGTTLLLDI